MTLPRPCRRFRLLLLLSVALAGWAGAQPSPAWAVQVVAVRDYRDAQAVVAELRVLGFDAYTEFAMLDGQQYVRVRVGCFTTRQAAESLAATLRGRVTAEAQAVDVTPGAPVLGCVDEEVGFLNAYDWELMSGTGGVAAFKVSVGGVTARVVHAGTRWQVLQGDGVAAGEPLPTVAPGLAAGIVVQRRVAGTPFAALESLPGPVLLCQGTLVTSVGSVAIVRRDDAIVACRLLTAQDWGPS